MRDDNQRVPGPAGKSLLTLLVCVAVPVGLIWAEGWGLWRDFSIRDRVVTAKAADILQGQCRATALALHICEATIRIDGVAPDTNYRLLFVDFSRGGYKMQVVQDRDNPAVVTTRLAIDMLPSRIIMFAAIVVGFGVAGIIALGKVFRRRTFERSNPAPPQSAELVRNKGSPGAPVGSRIPFPTRAIMVRPPSQVQVWVHVVLAFVFIPAICFLAWLELPGILKDFAMRERAEPARAAQILNTRCQVERQTIYWCNSTVRQRVNGVVRDTDHRVLFIAFSRPSQTTQVLQDRDNPAVVTTQRALDMLPNRIITFAVFVIALAVVSLVILIEIFKTRARNALYAALSGDILRPVTVRVTGTEDLGVFAIGGKVWHFQTPDGTAMENRFPNKAQPFFLDGVKRKALAVQGSRGQVLLLDEALSFLKLEPYEAQALRNWQGAAIAADRDQPIAVLWSAP